MSGIKCSEKKQSALIAAPLTSGASCCRPLGIRTFIIGFWRFFLILSLQPSEIDPKIKNPVFAWFLSLEFINEVAASKRMGYIFLALIVIDRV